MNYLVLLNDFYSVKLHFFKLLIAMNPYTRKLFACLAVALITTGTAFAAEEESATRTKIWLAASVTTSTGKQSEIIALSGDGNTAAGWAQSNTNANRAAVWTYDQDSKTWPQSGLMTLRQYADPDSPTAAEQTDEKTQNSRVKALSQDGHIAVGWSQSFKNVRGFLSDARAAIWTYDGTTWSGPSDLGSLLTPGSKTVLTGDRWLLDRPIRALDQSITITQYEENAITVANAVSADGTIIAGFSQRSEHIGSGIVESNPRAVVWNYDVANQKWVATDLGALVTKRKAVDSSLAYSKAKAESEANAVSDDGNTVAGWAQSDTSTLRAAVWTHGTNTWSITGLRSYENTLKSEVKALSPDGETAAGWTQSATSESRAAVWRKISGAWSASRDLGTLVINGSVDDQAAATSAVNALSRDGTVAAGWADYQSGTQAQHHAAVWTYDKDTNTWSDATDLRALDGFDESAVNAISDDATIAAGYSENHAGKRGTLWRLEFVTQTKAPESNNKSGLKHWSAASVTTSTGKQSEINALSGDGSTAAGWAQSDTNGRRAAVWNYDQDSKTWSKSGLMTLKQYADPDSPTAAEQTAEKTQNSRVNALSEDGHIAVGWSQSDQNHSYTSDIRAAIWTYDGTTWSGPSDLGSLLTPGSKTVLTGDSGLLDRPIRTIDITTRVLANEDTAKSAANAVSENGTIIAGWSQRSEPVASSGVVDSTRRAVVWNYDVTNQEWVATDLGALVTQKKAGDADLTHSKAQAESEVNVLSDDGNIAAGWAESDTSTHRAAVWTYRGDTWNIAELGSLYNDYADIDHPTNHEIAAEKALQSEVKAVSPIDESVAGWAQSDTSDIRAAIWTYDGTTWSGPSDLGTLVTNGSADDQAAAKSAVNAFSGDGQIAAGWADYESGLNARHHAAVWNKTANTWSDATDLGALDGFDDSVVNAVNYDATIAAGYSESRDGKRGTLWRLNHTENDNGETEMTNDDGETEVTVVGKPIDTQNTKGSIARVVNDSFNVMEQQRLTLELLQDSCNTAGAGQTCYSLGSGISSGIDDGYALASIGHGFSERFAAGLSFSISNTGLGHKRKGIDKDGANTGAGVWVKWREATADGLWYLRGSAGANRAKIRRTRSGFDNIEHGTGESTSKGLSLGAELGRVYDLADNAHSRVYGGLRYSHVKLPGYRETDAPAFPVSWTDMTSRQTSAYAGLGYGGSFGEAAGWSVNAELERDLSYNDPSLSATADGLGTMNFANRLARTRAVLSTELSYAFGKSAVLSFSPYLQRNATHKIDYGAMLQISGSF